MCLPQILTTSEIYERDAHYPGEPRRNRMIMFRPGGRRRYGDPLFRHDMMQPYHPPIGMGVGHMNHMGGHMGAMGHGIHNLPPPPPLPMLPPPPPNFNNGMHSNGGMQQPMNHQFNGGVGDHGVVQISGNDMGGQLDHGMNNRMHGGQFDHMGGQRFSGPRSPMPRGVRHGYGSIGSSYSDESYGSERGMLQRHSFGSIDDMYMPRHRGSYAGF